MKKEPNCIYLYLESDETSYNCLLSEKKCKGLCKNFKDEDRNNILDNNKPKESLKYYIGTSPYTFKSNNLKIAYYIREDKLIYPLLYLG